MDYEQHVREVAEEMARDSLADFSELSIAQKERYIIHFDGAARIAIRMVGDYIKAMLSTDGMSYEDSDKYLIDRDLIPAPEVECIEEDGYTTLFGDRKGSTPSEKCADCDRQYGTCECGKIL